MTPREVLALCREKDVRAVDLRFCDLWGRWQHITIPVSKLDEGVFEEGLGFNGASFRGWQGIEESDLLIVPQPGTAFLNPFTVLPTIVLICNVQDPVTGEPYSRDPRQIATKAANFLKHTGIADFAMFGPKAEFFVFEDAQFGQSSHEGFFQLDNSDAAAPRDTASADSTMDLRSDMMQAMIDCGLDVEGHHQQSWSAGQCQINLRHQPLVSMADAVMIYKHCVRSVSQRHGKTATFMPQPLMGASGSGMSTHLSLWRDEEPLFAGSGYAGLSETALYALGGILRHAPALLAFTCPTTNSYKRLMKDQRAPVNLVYAQRNRSAACRIPMSSQSPQSRRVEFRCPDPASNPYLAFAAILMAAIDGIQLKLNPGQPTEKDLFALPAEQRTSFAQTPETLSEALTALENDCEFLLADGVFTPDVIHTWIGHKREHEVDAIRRRPHPYEFSLYYDS